MPRRKCDACGKEKDISGGKTCENGHFICSECAGTRSIWFGERHTCPLCHKPLR